MATMKKDASTTTETVRVEYDYGSTGERRTKEFMDESKLKKFTAAKEKAGKNPKVLRARRKKKVEAGATKNTALQKLKNLWAAEKYREALKLAASWSRLGDQRDAIKSGWDATVNGRIYREMGKNPKAMYAAGLAAVAARYGLPTSPPEAGKAEEAPDIATSGTAGKPTKGKAKLQSKKSSPKKSTVPGVRPMRTRPYLAGTIIAKHGLAAGVTEAMVAELDDAYGKPNPTESLFCLKNAWHACRAFAGIERKE